MNEDQESAQLSQQTVNNDNLIKNSKKQAVDIESMMKQHE